MKISRNLIKSLNSQIAMEASASNNYLAMASWCEITGYEGSASFMYQHSDEERQHMLKIIHYLNESGIPAIIPAVKQPPASPKTLESVFKTALKNEQVVTKSISKMVEIAQKDKDHSTFSFLQWFVNEQIEEEKTFETILQKFDLLGRDKLAVYEIDKTMGSMGAAPAEQA